MTDAPDEIWTRAWDNARTCGQWMVRVHTEDQGKRTPYRRADLPHPEGAARIAALEAGNARLRDDLAEANRRLGGGCDAHPDKGDHTVIRQGKYSFCAACGESLKGIRYCHEPRPTLEAPE